ncbi:MAG: hypothetical protein HY905_12345 [Deltaproteobacteria bacterium]|nr:hypothetical protein [Deltaproteobacteria bacterium]
MAIRLRTFATFAVLLAPATACVPSPPPPVYDVHRAALVPPPLPPAWSGALRGPFGATIADSTLLYLGVPEKVADDISSLHVARTVIQTALRGRPLEWLELRIPFETALGAGAIATNEAGLATPDVSWGGGAGVGLYFDILDVAYVGVVADLLFYEIGSHNLAVCLRNCGADQENYDSQVLAVGILSLLAGWHDEHWRVFGGLTFRNHVTNLGRSEEVASGDWELQGELNGGPPYLTLSAGFDVAPLPWLSVFLAVHQPIALEDVPLTYAPIISGGLDVFIPD